MLIIAFFLSVIAFIFQGSFTPYIPILAFAPFLSLCIIKCPLFPCLIFSFCSGAILDLFSDDPMGIHALSYILITFFLFSLKNFLSEDDPFHLSLMSALFSCLATLLLFLFLFLFDRGIAFEPKWFIVDVLLMPIIDALYAFIWFTTPLFVYKQLGQLWKVFWLKKNRRSQT